MKSIHNKVISRNKLRLTFEETGNKFVDDVLKFAIESEGSMRFGFIESRLTDWTRGSRTRSLTLMKILQDAGSTEGVKSTTVDESSRIHEVTSAQIAGYPFVDVDQSGPFDGFFRQEREGRTSCHARGPFHHHFGFITYYFITYDTVVID